MGSIPVGGAKNKPPRKKWFIFIKSEGVVWHHAPACIRLRIDSIHACGVIVALRANRLTTLFFRVIIMAKQFTAKKENIMKKTNKTHFIITAALFLLFIVFTILVKTVDVAHFEITSPEIGFSSLNASVHEAIGVSETWYQITDILGILDIVTVALFGALGLWQWIRRKSLMKVDSYILLLGVFYALVAAVYVIFEIFVINYRPILVEGVWEASYPSSHTMLACCVLGSAMVAFSRLCAVKKWNIVVDVAASLVIVTMVVGRLLSGVHWLTDIVGGVLLSAALVSLYLSSVIYMEEKENT